MMPSDKDGVKPPPAMPPLPLNRDPARAIEMSISALQDILRRAPGTRSFFDYEAFIHHELQPALDALRERAVMPAASVPSPLAPITDTLPKAFAKMPRGVLMRLINRELLFEDDLDFLAALVDELTRIPKQPE